MPTENLEDKLKRIGSAVELLRNSPSRRFKAPYPDIYTTWEDEQEAWTKTAVLFDQSHHMTDVYFKGPDVLKLLQRTGVNSFATFGRNKAKHFVACNDDGFMIGSAVLFGLEDREVNLVGPTPVANWLQYLAETENYDVIVTRDERTADKSTARFTFRYEIEGPNALKILERAHGATLDKVKFFNMTEFTVGDVPVRALSHTMAGEPGAESMGMEIFGNVADGPAFLENILKAGEDFGLVRGGAIAYYTGGLESGYMAQPTPAIYTGERMKPYREWLAGDGYEGSVSLGGSFASPDIEDYYVTPYDFGYGHLVKFDHDFIGRDALEHGGQQSPRRKVWLRWNDDDVARVYASSLFGGDQRAKFLETPLTRYARIMWDEVRKDGSIIGVSTICGYTVNVGAWSSIAMLDEVEAFDGNEVTITWGEEDGGTSKLTVERHVQTTIRATVNTHSLIH